MTSNQFGRNDILLEEYKACRDRIGKEIDLINTFETTFVLAIGAIVAFIFSKDNRTIELFRVAMIIIGLICAYCYWRYGLHRKIIRIHEAYIEEQIEPFLNGGQATKTVGLVTFYNQNKIKHIKDIGISYPDGSLKKARYFIWVFIKLLAMMVFAYSFYDKTMFGLIY